MDSLVDPTASNFDNILFEYFALACIELFFFTAGRQNFAGVWEISVSLTSV